MINFPPGSVVHRQALSAEADSPVSSIANRGLQVIGISFAFG
jgi:hypothetical protein